MYCKFNFILFWAGFYQSSFSVHLVMILDHQITKDVVILTGNHFTIWHSIGLVSLGKGSCVDKGLGQMVLGSDLRCAGPNHRDNQEGPSKFIFYNFYGAPVVMGPGQNFLIQVWFGQLFIVWVWIWKISP